MLKIGTLRAKDIRKIVLILYEGSFTPFSLTQLAIRIVLLHKIGAIGTRSYNVMGPPPPPRGPLTITTAMSDLGRDTEDDLRLPLVRFGILDCL